MRFVALVSLCLALLAAIVRSADPPNATAYATSGNQTWVLYKEKFLWLTAEVACRNLFPGGHLVHFPTEQNAAALVLLNQFLATNSSVGPSSKKICTWAGLSTLVPASDADNDAFATSANLKNLLDARSWNADASCSAFCSNGTLSLGKLARRDCDYEPLSFVCKVKQPASNLTLALGSAVNITLQPFSTLVPNADNLLTPDSDGPPGVYPPSYGGNGAPGVYGGNGGNGGDGGNGGNGGNGGSGSPGGNGGNGGGRRSASRRLPENNGFQPSVVFGTYPISATNLAFITSTFGGTDKGCNWTKLNDSAGYAKVAALTNNKDSKPPTVAQVSEIATFVGCGSNYNFTAVLYGLGITLSTNSTTTIISTTKSDGPSKSELALPSGASAQQVKLFNLLKQVKNIWNTFNPSTCQVAISVINDAIETLNTTNSTLISQFNAVLSSVPGGVNASVLLEGLIEIQSRNRDLCNFVLSQDSKFQQRVQTFLKDSSCPSYEDFLFNQSIVSNFTGLINTTDSVITVKGNMSGTITTSNGPASFSNAALSGTTSSNQLAGGGYAWKATTNGTVVVNGNTLFFIALLMGNATGIVSTNGPSNMNLTGLISVIYLDPTCIQSSSSDSKSNSSSFNSSFSFDPRSGSTLGGNSSTSLVNLLLGIFSSGTPLTQTNGKLLIGLLGGKEQGCNWTSDAINNTNMITFIASILSSPSQPSPATINSIATAAGCSNAFSLSSLFGLTAFPPRPPPSPPRPPAPPGPLSSFKYSGNVNGDDAAGKGGGSDEGTKSFDYCSAFGSFTYCGSKVPYSLMDAEQLCEYWLGYNASLVTITTDNEFTFIKNTFPVSSSWPGYWTAGASAGFGKTLYLRAFAPNDPSWMQSQTIVTNSSVVWQPTYAFSTYNITASLCDKSGQCGVAYTIANGSALQFVDPGFGLGVLCKVPSNQTSKYYSRSANIIAERLQGSTPRDGKDIVLQVPLKIKFGLSNAACQQIAANSSLFRIALANSTAEDWNKKNPLLAILDGDVQVADVIASCVASGRRSLSQSSTVDTSINVNTPPGTTTDQATSASSTYSADGGVGLTGTAMASSFQISGITSLTSQTTQALSAAAISVSPPPPANLSPPSPANNNMLAIAVGAGVGGGVLVLAGVILTVVLVKKKKKVNAAVAPTPHAPEEPVAKA